MHKVLFVLALAAVLVAMPATVALAQTERVPVDETATNDDMVTATVTAEPNLIAAPESSVTAVDTAAVDASSASDANVVLYIVAGAIVLVLAITLLAYFLKRQSHGAPLRQ